MNSTLTTIPRSFLSDYEKRNWFDDDVYIGRAIDDADQPFFWDAARDRHARARTQSFTSYLHSNAMCTGLVVPLSRRPGTASLFSLISQKSRVFRSGTAEAAQLIGTAALAKTEALGVCRSVSADEAKGAKSLSAIQLEILNWVTEGKSNPDIATIMGMSERAVRYHISVILQTFGVAARSQAAAIHLADTFDTRRLSP